MRFAKPVVFTVCLLPFAWLLWLVYTSQLGSNPVEELLHQTGSWALRFLLVVLAVTPLRKLSGWTVVLRFRRMLGLFAFFYASLHFSVYFLLDLGMDLAFVVEDILKRPYITVGFTALVLLVPLAVTSTKGMMRRLGPNWKKLHRLVYLIGILGVVHYIWLIKADLLEPLIYATILLVLLVIRKIKFNGQSGQQKKKGGNARADMAAISEKAG